MISFRVKLENGVLVPQEATPQLEDGQEYVVSVVPSLYAARLDAVKAMLARTRGIWADVDATEDAMLKARRERLAAWTAKHVS